MGQVIAARFMSVGGDALDEAIQRHLQARHGVEVSALQAREIKHRLGFAGPAAEDTMAIQGRDQANGLPARRRG